MYDGDKVLFKCPSGDSVLSENESELERRKAFIGGKNVKYSLKQFKEARGRKNDWHPFGKANSDPTGITAEPAAAQHPHCPIPIFGTKAKHKHTVKILKDKPLSHMNLRHYPENHIQIIFTPARLHTQQTSSVCLWHVKTMSSKHNLGALLCWRPWIDWFNCLHLENSTKQAHLYIHMLCYSVPVPVFSFGGCREKRLYDILKSLIWLNGLSLVLVIKRFHLINIMHRAVRFLDCADNRLQMCSSLVWEL